MFYPQDIMQDYGRLSGRHTALEAALASTPLFRSRRLRLYRQDIFLNPNRERIDYLVVKDHVPVLKLILSPWRTKDGRWYMPGTEDEPPLLVVYTKKPCLQDLVDDVTTHLEPLLKNPDTYQKRDTYVPVPPEYHETMARLHMIQKQEDHIWAPTGYGDWLGLMDGYIAWDGGKPCHTFFIPSERRDELYSAINWNQTCWEEPEHESGISLQQRLDKLRQGLPLNNASAIEMVRVFGAMPMADYMASDPETAEELSRRFGETATFQEAADKIFQFYTSPNDCYDRMEFVAALVLPLFNIHEGKAPVNQATEPVQEFLHQPFPSVLMGAAMAATQPRLVWNTKLIQDMLKRGSPYEKADKLLTTPCWKVLRSMNTHSEENSEASIDIIVRLIVEPFALLHRAAAL